MVIEVRSVTVWGGITNCEGAEGAFWGDGNTLS